ncbi:antitoxin VbhA family protein [Pseudomonas sp. NPDC087612]|uniref:antitoxin VbhA family protein n=1 Tax=Pseudomonas sp. NPDC087612 TaxID=3364441 RepID=UPI003805AFC5
MQIDEHERERRRIAVAVEIGCQALEGGQLTAEHLAELQRYVDGQVCLDELRAELIERLKLDDE